MNLFQGVITCVFAFMMYTAFGFMVASAITEDSLWMNVAIGTQITASLVGGLALVQGVKQDRQKGRGNQ